MSRNRFPLNIHSAISMANEGVSLRTKKTLVIAFLVFITLIITWAGYNIFKGTKLSILAGLISLCIAIGISVFLYNHFIINKQEDTLEDSHGNKIFKFFKLSLNSGYDEQNVDRVECSRYISGDLVVGLKLSLGHLTKTSETITEEFFDSIFGMSHSQKIKIDVFTIPEDWETSDMHIEYLKRLTSIGDIKLKTTLSKLDEYQSEIYKDSSVVNIIILFQVANNKTSQLIPIIRYVAGWKKENLKHSSLRTISWVTRQELIKNCCDYLGTKMIDVSPLANKEEKIVLDIRKMVRPYPEDTFFGATYNEKVELDTEAVYIRHSKIKMKGSYKNENYHN